MAFPRSARLSVPSVAFRLFACLLLACLLPSAVAATGAAPSATPLRFGILPTGGPSESRQDWQPLLDDLARALGRPVEAVSVSTYEGMHRAIVDRRVDVAFLSGKLALDTVLQDRMHVIARLARRDGSTGYRSVLLARRGGPVRDLAMVLGTPGRWRYARGEELSVSGYMVPEAQLFARRGINTALHFRSVTVDNHQNNALAVANGEADVASNNSADLERFAARFPDQYARLRVLWRSDPIPHAVLVASRRLDARTHAAVRDFLVGYGSGQGERAAQQQRNLRRIHELAGFGPADDLALLPFADIAHTLQVRQAQARRWIDDEALQARLERLRVEHVQVKARLARTARTARASAEAPSARAR
ncbi:MAG TPA: phosphate/phosphite/phosphonate ABC transporter substrate-binding protein [Luteimonas sp.]|nr:phosphate/phosphite/phosphonate ABC transporter substrate-binding protein [Luteimonas sp.]